MSELVMIDETEGGARGCPPATAGTIAAFQQLQTLCRGKDRVVLDGSGHYGAAPTRRGAARLAGVSADRVAKGVLRTYAPNGLREVVEFPAWIVT